MSSVHNFATPSSVGGRYDHLVRPDGMVHRTLYTDPRIFEEEMIKIFGGSWVFLVHEAEISNPHDFKTTTVGRRPVIVSRSADGKVHALLNRCTHRGSLVCVAEHGNTKRFQCPYHSWAFGSDGELLAVTYPDGYGPTFDKKAHGLGRLPRVESYRGYVFGSLNKDVEPLVDWLGAARSIIDWCVENGESGPRGVRVVKGRHYMFRGNWKHQNDNNCDAYHAPFLHSSLAKMNQVRYGTGKGLDHIKGDDNPMFVQYLGNGHKLIDQRPAITSTWERARPIPGRESHAAAVVMKVGDNRAADYLELVGRTGINLILYPNLFIMGNGTFAVYEPVTVDHTNVRYYTVLLNDVPEEINTLRVRFAEDFNNVGAPDDIEAMERSQQALTLIPEMEWLNLSRGLGTSRERVESNGVITGNIMDETGVRGSYHRWIELMNREVRLSVA
jgi:phenylpropionate dioxygenase-like ring-hydroxylating dioxygenase large terminal subunit